MSSLPHSPQCLCLSRKKNLNKTTENKEKSQHTYKHSPLAQLFFPLSIYQCLHLLALYVQQTFGIYHKNGETRQNLVREWRQGSIKNSICTHIELCYKGKKFGAKTFLEELFFFFLSGSKWTCSKLLLPTYYSLKEIFPIPLEKKKKRQCSPLWCKHTFKAPFKIIDFVPFSPTSSYKPTAVLMQISTSISKKCMHAFPLAHVYLYQTDMYKHTYLCIQLKIF